MPTGMPLSIVGLGGGLSVQYRDPRGIPSREEEMALIRRAQAGDVEARNELIERHYGFIKRQALRYAEGQKQIDDYVQVASLAYLEVIGKFDSSKGTRLNTYAAWWMWQAMQRHGNGLRIVFVPPWIGERKVLPKPTKASQIQERIRMLAAAREAMGQVEALILESRDGDRRSEANEPIDPHTSEPTGPIEKADEIDGMLRAVESLEPVEREIICRRFGIGTGKPESLDKIAPAYSCSRERVRQVEAEALAKLRERMGVTLFGERKSLRTKAVG